MGRPARIRLSRRRHQRDHGRLRAAHVTLKEALAYAKSVMKGDSDVRHVIGETFKDAVASVLKKEK